MATEPNYLPNHPPFNLNWNKPRKHRRESSSNPARAKLLEHTVANAVYLIGSLLFLAGEMELGSILFIVGNVATLLRIVTASVYRFHSGMLHEGIPHLFSLAGCCFFYLREVPPGTILFIAGSLYSVVYLLIPVIRNRDVVAFKLLVPLILSLIGCFFFLTSVRVVGTLLFILSNGMLLQRSLSLLLDSRTEASKKVAS